METHQHFDHSLIICFGATLASVLWAKLPVTVVFLLLAPCSDTNYPFRGPGGKIAFFFSIPVAIATSPQQQCHLRNDLSVIQE